MGVTSAGLQGGERSARGVADVAERARIAIAAVRKVDAVSDYSMANLRFVSCSHESTMLGIETLFFSISLNRIFVSVRKLSDARNLQSVTISDRYCFALVLFPSIILAIAIALNVLQFDLNSLSL